jgi:hypothetical protein
LDQYATDNDDNDFVSLYCFLEDDAWWCMMIHRICRERKEN